MMFDLSHSALLREPAFTRQFVIGAELELYASGAPLPEGAKETRARRIPADIKAKYGHLFDQRSAKRNRASKKYGFDQARDDILKLLSTQAPSIPWAKRLSFDTDGSLSGARPGEFGIEIVLNHASGPKALVALGELFRILGSAPNYRCDKDCGLHLNASFSDAKLNIVDVLSRAHEHIPVASLLSTFGRASNSYCENNAKSTIDIEEIFRAQDEIVETLAKIISGGKRAGYVSLADFSKMVEDLAQPAKIAQFQASLLRHARTTQLLQWESDRPACAPRLLDVDLDSKQSKAANYVEFRMMGGPDYLRREIDIAAGIQLCLEGLLASAGLYGAPAAPRREKLKSP